MSDHTPNVGNYLITLIPPPEPGSAACRAMYDYVRKLQVTMPTGSGAQNPTSAGFFDAQSTNFPSTFSQLDISSATISRPRPDPLSIPSNAPTGGEGQLEAPPGSSDSASDVGSPTGEDSVGSISETSDTEPPFTRASHRAFNLPQYMPLPNAVSGSTSAGRAGPKSNPELPGYRVLSGVIPGEVFKRQIFLLRAKITQQIPNDLAGFYTGDHLPTFGLIFDPGYSTTWTFGSHCQKLVIPDSDTNLPLTLPVNPSYHGGFYGEGEGPPHMKILAHAHAPAGGPPIPATSPVRDAHYGCTKFVNGTAAVFTLTEEKQQLQFVDCVQWDRVSWDSPLNISSRIGVAHWVTPGLYLDANMDGLIGFAPTDFQTSFDLSNYLHAPSILSSFQSASQVASVDTADGGVVIYCALRPFAWWNKDAKTVHLNNFESWIALNRWPIRLPNRPQEESTPEWSEKIKLWKVDSKCPSWNILLLSMKFVKYDSATKKYVDVPGGEIVFDGGLVTILDPGCAASWVPPEVVRCVRTALFPCEYNRELDARLGDAPTVIQELIHKRPSELNYMVHPPNFSPHSVQVKYRFSNGPGSKPVVVLGPVDQFVLSLNPETPMNRSASARPEYEGLLFVPPPGSIHPSSTANKGPAIFGINFFQSMFVALHKPGKPNRKPYVRLAPQWYGDTRAGKYGPPPNSDD